MTTSELLIKARKILSDPSRWTQGFYRRKNQDGTHCYCALGAIYAAAGYYDESDPVLRDRIFDNKIVREADATLGRVITEQRPDLESDWVPTFNDHSTTTYEDVQQAFSTAINVALADEYEARTGVAA